MTRCVAFLSDYGHRDPFVGVCHAVIRNIDPTIPVIDLAHGIAAQDVRAGAIALCDSVPYLPRRAIVLAVVDPGVGGARRAVAVDAFNGLTFVGPDNGLLAAAVALAGGAEAVVEISASSWRMEPVSPTFHGRDLFAPVAAHLAAGKPLSAAGQPLDPAVLTQLALPGPHVNGNAIAAEAIDIDIYGNIRLAAAVIDLAAIGAEPGTMLEIEAAGLRTPASYARSFGDVGEHEPLVFEDSNGSLAVGINCGDAAAELGVRRGAKVRILGP